MVRRLSILLASLMMAMLLPLVAPASAAGWGPFDEMAVREWTTDREPRARVTLFRWERQGAVLVARHGFQSRLQFGTDKFADTVQRLVLNPKTGLIDVTYSYEDGRPPLKAVIKVQPDGSAIESFTDANGVQKRNIYRSPSLSLNVIERQELRDGKWAVLGQTRKLGLTQDEIAEKVRREAEARQLALEQEQALQAKLRAIEEQSRAEMAAMEEQERAERDARQASSPNTLQILQGLGQQIQRQNVENQARYDRQLAQMRADVERRKAEEARQEAERLGRERQRKIDEVNARQEAIRQQNDLRNSADASAASQAQAEQRGRAQDRERQAAAEQQQRQEDERLALEKERQRKETEAARQAEIRRQAEAQRLAEQKRREDEANRPVAFREGVVLCKQQGPKSWRCDGPLQFDYGDVNDETGLRAVRMACGGGSPNKIGMWAGYMAYGCGYGIHPTDRDYPGNRDIPAQYGVGMPPGTRTFYCKRSVNAYCRGGR